MAEASCRSDMITSCCCALGGVLGLPKRPHKPMMAVSMHRRRFDDTTTDFPPNPPIHIITHTHTHTHEATPIHTHTHTKTHTSCVCVCVCAYASVCTLTYTHMLRRGSIEEQTSIVAVSVGRSDEGAKGSWSEACFVEWPEQGHTHIHKHKHIHTL